MKKRCFLAWAALPLAACSLGPPYQRPPLDVPDSFRSQQETPGKQSIADLTWWEMYQDPVLQGLLRTALEQNRDIKTAAARVMEARALTGTSRLAQLPQVDVAVSATRGRESQAGAFATGNAFAGQAEVSFDVDIWRRLSSLSEAARANLLASEYAQNAIKIGVISDVATAYFTLLSLDQQLDITRRTVLARERFLQLTQSKFRRGVASGLDMDRAQANLASVYAAIPDLERQIAQAENQLQILLGHNPAPVVREPRDLTALPLPPVVPAGLPSTLLERRPDVREAEYNLEGTTANVRAARASLFPSISLTGSYGSQSIELSKLFSGPTKVWSFGLSLLQPLINAERNGYQVDASEARRQQALLQYQNTVALAFREVSDALVARQRYAEFLTAQKQQVDALRQVNRRVLRRYDIGYSSYFEVIDADTNLYAAELQLAQAYRNNILATVQLYKALGGGWQR